MSEASERGIELGTTAVSQLDHRLRARVSAAVAALGRTRRERHGGSYARRGAVVVLIVALAVFTWPVLASLTPAAGLDNSWQLGLSLALARGLVFGRQILFSYGPLGLVAEPRAVTGGTLLLALVGAAAIQLALVAVLLRSLRRWLSLPIAALITLLGLSIIASPALGAPPLDEIAVGLVAIALTAPAAKARQATRTLALAGGVLAGLALLVKLNDGIGATAIVTVGLLGGVSRRRHLAIGALTVVLTTSLAWLALGEPLGALPDYFQTGISTVGGYVDAMGYNVLGPGGQWEVLVVILSALVLTAAAWSSLSDAPLRRRVALAGCVLLVHYFVAREMFVRYDGGHAAVLALLVAIPLLLPWRREQLAGGLAIAAGLAVASLAVLGGDGLAVGSVFDPFGRESALVSDIKTMISPQPAIAVGRSEIAIADGVPPAIVDNLNGHCVNAEPVEVSAIFAHPAWRWCPVGVMQSYAAYTTQLDNLDAAGYANARSGPDRVLRQVNATIDGRNPTWESPAAMLSLLCHFKEISRGGQWQALARIPDRCGKPRLLGTVHSNGPGVLRVPPAPRGTVLVAQVKGLQIYKRERLETLFARAAERTVVINGAVTYRVVPDTLTDGLMLDVPAGADYLAPFAFNLAVSTIEAEINQVPVAFSVTLLAVPIKPAAIRRAPRRRAPPVASLVASLTRITDPAGSHRRRRDRSRGTGRAAPAVLRPTATG